MKITKVLGLALGFSLLSVGLAFLTTIPAPAQAPTSRPRRQGSDDERPPLPPFPPISVTVTNPPLVPQLASDTVTLQATTPLSASCGFGLLFDRSVVKSGGTVTAFSLPAGKVLVATSLDWVDGGSAARANLARTVFLFRYNGGVNGPSAQSTAIADSSGRVGASETFPSGLVLQNPGQFCIGADPTGGPLASGEFFEATLNGFLAPDR